MADAAISTLVQLLGNLLIEKVKFLGAVAGEVEWLKAELQSMQCFLQDAEEKQATENRVRDWISSIRKLAFDAEDVLEIFILNVENPRKSTGLLGKCGLFPNHVYHLDRVGEKINAIRQRLEAIKQRREAYGIKDLGERMDWTEIPDHVEWRRRLIPTQQDQDVVGLENDVDSLLNRAILDGRNSLSSATIMGLPGIGKSTLARAVYNHKIVGEKFKTRAWVVVSNEFRPRQIFKDLILKLLEPSEDRSKVSKSIQDEDAPNLQQMLYDRLKGKKYFIVLDDVWEDAHWSSLANAFPAEDNGSRLLLTSRSQISTKYTRYTHPMQILNSTESWKLFLKKALIDNTEEKCPKDLEELGRKMVGKCEGLPLAINAVGGVLLKEGPSKSGWAKVLEGIDSYLGRSGSVVFDILELSYQNLPKELKPCFLSLSFLKEDAFFGAEKLKNIWISQGFIKPEGEEKLEAIATRYVDEMIYRNLIQVKDLSSDDQIKRLQVHDLIRELSITKAKEEMGLEILRDEASCQSSDTPRHRAIYKSDIDPGYSRNEHIRSLFVCVDVIVAPSTDSWKTFQLLKLLDLEDCASFTELPETIGALIGLKYLGLKNTRITKFPGSFRKLKNLEVIELSDYVCLPSSAWKFIKLRQIHARVDWPEVAQKLSFLKSIHRLKSLHIERHSDLEQLVEMTNIYYLAIHVHDSTVLTKVFTSLSSSKNLVRLTLRSEYFGIIDGLDALRHVTRLKIYGIMTQLPTSFPPTVSHLTLKNSYLLEDPMPVLEMLPCLSYLFLNCAYCGPNMVISDYGFPKLKVLKFHSMPQIWSVQVGKGAMPELKRAETNGFLKVFTTSMQEQVLSSNDVDLS